MRGRMKSGIATALAVLSGLGVAFATAVPAQAAAPANRCTAVSICLYEGEGFTGRSEGVSCSRLNRRRSGLILKRLAARASSAVNGCSYELLLSETVRPAFMPGGSLSYVGLTVQPGERIARFVDRGVDDRIRYVRHQ